MHPEGASEFLSEASPEFEAVRRAAADARAARPADELFSSESPPARRTAASVTAGIRAWRRVLGGLLVASVALAGLAAWWRGTEPSPAPANAAATAAPGGAPPSAAAAPAAEPAIVEGSLTIESRPAGADVFVDDIQRGTTPLELALPVGPHVVELRNGAATRRLDVTVDASTAVREIVDLAPVARPGRAGAPNAASAAAAPGPVSVEGGWVAFRSPLELDVFEGGQRLGTTRTSRLLLAAGPHDLELVSDDFEFRTTVTGVVTEGRVITLPVALPTGQLSINAVPWANVWVDDRPLGSTPLANIAVPIGDREVVWRHPELGERRQTIRVGARTPARVGVDLTR